MKMNRRINPALLVVSALLASTTLAQVEVAVDKNADGTFIYSYTVSNPSSSPVQGFHLAVSGPVQSVTSPNHWSGLYSPRGLNGPTAYWGTVNSTAEIAPGASLSGFSIRSIAPPGEVRFILSIPGQDAKGLTTGPVAILNNDSRFLRGDANGDAVVDISDPLTILGALFVGEGEMACEDAADSNDDSILDISDAVHTLSFLFLGSVVVPAPGTTSCGPDPSADSLGCDSEPPCPG